MNKFLKGAAVLAVAGLLVKVMGIFFRIPLTLWVGADGLSYYSSVYPIYTFILILSTSGFPVAISRMVSERIAIKNYGGADKVFKTSLTLMAAIGFVSFAIVFVGAGFIEKVVLNNEGTIYSIRAIAPALLLVPVMSSFRGYFQGRQNMNPTAISQFVEQMFRVGVGLLLAYIFLDKGNEFVSAGATFGCTAGALAGLAVVVLIYFFARKHIKRQISAHKDTYIAEPTKEIIKKMLIIAIPITIGASILPLINTIDSMMIMRILQKHFTFEESKLLWGRLGGYVDSLTGLPQVFITAIAMSLVPAISASFKLKNTEEMHDNMNLALRSAMIISCPCAVGMFTLAHPILKLLYPTAERAQEVMDAVPTLRICCVLIILAAVIQTATGALQGIGKQMVPVWNIAMGAVLKVIATAILTNIVVINVNGGPLGSIFCYTLAAILDLRALKKCTNLKISAVNTFIKPFVASVVMGVFAWGSYTLVNKVIASNTICTFVSIMFAVVVYALIVVVTKTIKPEEIARLPKGEMIVKLLKKVHLVK